MALNRSAAVGVVVLGAAAACGRGGPGAGAPAAHVDTTNTEVMDGMSSQQVEAKAEALTPEQAAARGIAVDSSIHVENLGSPDSAPPRADTAQPGRAGAAPPAGADSARPRP